MSIASTVTDIHCYIGFKFLKIYRFKHTCNGDNDIRHRKQQKLAYRIRSHHYYE